MKRTVHQVNRFHFYYLLTQSHRRLRGSIAHYPVSEKNTGRSFARELGSLPLCTGWVFHGEGILAVNKVLLPSSISYIGGCASARQCRTRSTCWAGEAQGRACCGNWASCTSTTALPKPTRPRCWAPRSVTRCAGRSRGSPRGGHQRRVGRAVGPGVRLRRRFQHHPGAHPCLRHEVA